MLNVASIAQRNAMNVVSLNDVLAGGGKAFRMAILNALRLEGFDIGEPLPNLQQPREILDAIGWMATRGFGERWVVFLSALQDADKAGILVDLSSPLSDGDTSPNRTEHFH